MPPQHDAGISSRIAAVEGWRGETLARMRELIHEALPTVVETMKWKKPSNPLGTPTWETHDGKVICVGDAFKDKVKLTFARGALVPDPKRVFNAGLEGKLMRAIDLKEGATVDGPAFMELIRAAAAGRPQGSPS